MRGALAAAVLVVLMAYSYGTYRRNEVWRNETSLWKDVTSKSPKNGRGLMNYGCTRMSIGDIRGALDYFNRARIYTPSYYVLEINLAIANGQIGRDADAEQHFQRAIALAPDDALPYFYYGRWLEQHERGLEALIRAQKSVGLNPSYQEAQALLGKVQGWGHWNADALAEAEKSIAARPGAEAYLNLSLRYHQAKRYQDCIRTANEALKLKSDFPEAYNNIAAGYEALGQWDEAIQAARKSLSLRPDFQLAKNNLAWSESQKALATARPSGK
jgi:tetratricopeptide (TPR) repeat protein